MKELTQENYYQDKEYLSYSRMKQFLKCPARALAVEGALGPSHEMKHPCF